MAFIRLERVAAAVSIWKEKMAKQEAKDNPGKREERREREKAKRVSGEARRIGLKRCGA